MGTGLAAANAQAGGVLQPGATPAMATQAPVNVAVQPVVMAQPQQRTPVVLPMPAPAVVLPMPAPASGPIQVQPIQVPPADPSVDVTLMPGTTISGPAPSLESQRGRRLSSSLGEAYTGGASTTPLTTLQPEKSKATSEAGMGQAAAFSSLTSMASLMDGKTADTPARVAMHTPCGVVA